MADEDLRRRERDARATPGDPQAQDRATRARTRAGEPPAAHRTLMALETAARARRGSSSRACALAHVAWGWARVGEPTRAAALAREAGDEPSPDRAAIDLWIDALARAGAALASCGDPGQGLALLVRGGSALHGLAEPWSDLPRLHQETLRACAQAGFDPRGLREAWPGLGRSVAQLARGAVLGGVRLERELLASLGLVDDVLAEVDTLAGAGPDPGARGEHLAAQTAAVRAALDLGRLDASRAAQLLDALAAEVETARDYEEPIDELVSAAAIAALRVAGDDPAARARAWAAALEARRRTTGAAHLRLAALALDDPAQDPAAALATLLRLAATQAPWRQEPGRVLARVVPVLARGAAGAAHLETLLDRLPGGPLSRADVLEALARHAGSAPRPEALLRRVQEAARAILHGPGAPVWAALDALVSVAGTSLALGLHDLVEAVAVDALRAIDATQDQPGLGYAGVRAAVRLASAAWPRHPAAREWRRAATAALPHLAGQDLEDAALDAVQALASSSDAAWRVDGLAEVADGLAAAQAQLLGDRHVIPPLRALAAVLDPP